MKAAAADARSNGTVPAWVCLLIGLACALTLASCAPEAAPPELPKPPRLSERAAAAAASFDKTFGHRDYYNCAGCHVAPASEEPALADIQSLVFSESSGMSGFHSTTTVGADGHIVRQILSPKLPAGQERVDTVDVYPPSCQKLIARLLASGYFRVPLGGLSSCSDVGSVRLVIRTADGREFRVDDPCWRTHWPDGTPDHPGFGACVAVVRELLASLDYRMPELEPAPR